MLSIQDARDSLRFSAARGHGPSSLPGRTEAAGSYSWRFDTKPAEALNGRRSREGGGGRRPRTQRQVKERPQVNATRAGSRGKGDQLPELKNASARKDSLRDTEEVAHLSSFLKVGAARPPVLV